MAEGGDDFQRALVDNFIAVTGADVERATFFLQSAAWNLQVMIFDMVDAEDLIICVCHRFPDCT